MPKQETCEADAEIRGLIASTPAVQAVQTQNYRWFKFYENGKLKGILGYWVVDGEYWSGTYAFVVIVSLEKGWGHRMLEEVLDQIPADLLIWPASSAYKKSVNLAERFGFSTDMYQRFWLIEGLDVPQELYIGARLQPQLTKEKVC